jgi:hypothetical protein
MKCPLVLRGDAGADSGRRWYIRLHKGNDRQLQHTLWPLFPHGLPRVPAAIVAEEVSRESGLRRTGQGLYSTREKRAQSLDSTTLTAWASAAPFILSEGRRARGDDPSGGCSMSPAASWLQQGWWTGAGEAHTGWPREQSRGCERERDAMRCCRRTVRCGTWIRRPRCDEWRRAVGDWSWRAPCCAISFNSWRRAVAAFP